MNTDSLGKPTAQILSRFLKPAEPASESPMFTKPLIGVFEGNGIGPEVISAALKVLAVIQEALGVECELRHGGAIGEQAEADCGHALTDDVVKFCEDIFNHGGAILNGPGGGRYVYDLRRTFDLFCKFVPIQPWPELMRAGKLVPQQLRGVDILLVRDNAGGVYQGEWAACETTDGRFASHSFNYTEAQVRRVIEVAARAAAARRGQLHIIAKQGGVPAITALWREIGFEVARRHRVEPVLMNVDLAAYELIQRTQKFDVIVAPNLFGDILADIAGVLVGSRGMTFSGNFDGSGRAVYQTNHGCAHDLAGRDVANPAGQILSLAMLLRESFGMDRAARLIETSLAETWRQGWRTEDIIEPGCRLAGTRAFTQRVVEEIARRSEQESLHETRAVAG